jgi:hypothetical protein
MNKKGGDFSCEELPAVFVEAVFDGTSRCGAKSFRTSWNGLLTFAMVSSWATLRQQRVKESHFHECIFLESGQPAEVQPAVILAVLQVVPLALDRPEGGAPQAVQLQSHGLSILPHHLKDI